MDRIFPFEQLAIIGCKEVPVLNPSMPRLLSAIFAVRDSNIVLFPPYTLGDQELILPVVATRQEFDDLVACEEVSAFGPTQALPEHELSLDDEGNFHYEPSYQARENLKSIFETRCGLAERALNSGLLSVARTHAMIANSANPKNLKPLLYRAAAELRMISSHADPDRVRAELALTETLAKPFVSILEFRKLYVELANGPEKRSKFAGIAMKKPSPASIPFPELVCHA